MPPKDEDNETGNNDRDLSDVIEPSAMGRSNRDLKVMSGWENFRAQALYDDDNGGESDVMLFQGTWFDR